jgi:hypothetical protein
VSHVAWTRERPTKPGFYGSIPLPHETDEARDDIHGMAKGGLYPFQIPDGWPWPPS